MFLQAGGHRAAAGKPAAVARIGPPRAVTVQAARWPDCESETCNHRDARPAVRHQAGPRIAWITDFASAVAGSVRLVHGDARPTKTIARTKLADWRLRRGVSQPALAKRLGISLSSYRRLENGEISEPNLRWLVNASFALGCELEDLLEDDWMRWLPGPGASKPPDREYF